MTTAAPPEKMTNAELVEAVRDLGVTLTLDHEALLREAARRLSDKPTLLPDMIQRLSAPADGGIKFRAEVKYDDHTDIVEGTFSAPPAPRVGDGWTGRKCPRCNGFGQDDEAHACKACGGTGEEYGPLDAALSAPPAASADEREIVVKTACTATDVHLLCAFPKCACKNAPAMVDAILALGYRKLAPAQSVGQSAAQGVGEFAAELVKWCDEHLAAHPDVTVRTTLAFVIDHIRRLSALPKGQKGDV